MSQAWMTWAFFFIIFFFTPLPTPARRAFWQRNDSQGPRGQAGAIWGPKLGNYTARGGHRHVPCAAAKECARARACTCMWVCVFFVFFLSWVYVGALASARHAPTARVAPVVCFHRTPSLSGGGGGGKQRPIKIPAICVPKPQPIYPPPQNKTKKKSASESARAWMRGVLQAWQWVSEHFIHTQGLRSKATETCHNTQTTQISKRRQNR